jgi:hypothetical protein
MNQEYLNYYFKEIWKPGYDPKGKTGDQLLSKIKVDDWVLDVGCGYNTFVGRIDNLIGIDPANDSAHIKCSIEDFEPSRLFDVALCLGSINFGDDIVIEQQIKKVVSCLTPNGRIYWRCNPGRKDHGNQECQQIEFYPWSFEKLMSFASQFGFEVLELSWDDNRIYSEWVRV